MPAQEEHLAVAKRNEEFAQLLAEKTRYIDWAVTILYYSALHYVDAVLAVSQIHPANHSDRHTAIGRNDSLKRVYAEYRTLEAASRNARYYAVPIDAGVWKEVKPDFDALRTHIRLRLGLEERIS